MQVYLKTIIVLQEDLDQLNHVNNVRYVQWVQDIAEEHWLKNATKEIIDDCYWVLLSHHIDYKDQAVLNDEILVKTFVVKSEGVRSERHVEFYNKSNQKLIVHSKTNWCLMSKINNRPTRISDTIKTLFN